MLRSLRRMLTCSVVLAATLAATLPALALDLGDEAPEVDVAKWVQGEPVKVGDGEHIVILHFFASFNGESVASAKSLSEFQGTMEAKGVVVVSVTNEGQTSISDLVANNPIKHRIASDPDRNTIGPYMGDVIKLPYAVVVDKKGQIAWKGVDMDDMQSIVKKMAEGTYDPRQAQRLQELRGSMLMRLWSRDWAKLADETEEILKYVPEDGQALENWSAAVAGLKDKARYHKFLDEHSKKIQENGDALNALAWMVITNEEISWRDVELALETAKRAVELSKRKNPAILDTLARVWFEIGAHDKAIAVQKEAVAAAGGPDDPTKSDAGPLRETLEQYERVKAMKKKLGL